MWFNSELWGHHQHKSADSIADDLPGKDAAEVNLLVAQTDATGMGLSGRCFVPATPIGYCCLTVGWATNISFLS